MADGSREGPAPPETVLVAGAEIDRALVEERRPRPAAAFATARFGEGEGERQTALRRVAGALALHCDVEVLVLDDRVQVARQEGRPDGIFTVHPVSARRHHPSSADGPADRARARVIRAALSAGSPPPGQNGAARLPREVARRMAEAAMLESPASIRLLEELRPGSAVLAGTETAGLVPAVAHLTPRPRTVFLPMLGTDRALLDAVLPPLAGLLDAIGVFSESERQIAEESVAGATAVHLLHPTFAVHGSPRRSGLAGLGRFGRYVLLISGWPDDDPLSRGSLPHDLIRRAAGDVAIAEVRPGQWLVTDARRSFEVAWPPSRVNLWHLMSRALLTLDMRLAGPVGEEAIESMMFGTPVIVPAASPAAGHAKAANGGLWYESEGEMLDQLRLLASDEAVRRRLGEQGRDWAISEHGEADRFADEIRELVLG
jgi:hypothetical protein